MSIFSRRLAGALLAMLAISLPVSSADKLKVKGISWGDELSEGTYSSKTAIEEAFRKLKEQGYTDIYWRMIWDGAPHDEIEFYMPDSQQAGEARVRKELENTPYAWDPHELRWPAAVAHRLGMRLWAHIVPYNMGAPPGAWAELGIMPHPQVLPDGLTIYLTNFLYQYKILRQHPEYQLVDRKGKRYHYGVMEWAYPEARQYWDGLVKDIVTRYDVDGISMDTRSECMNPEYADEFGFNAPVVEEFKRRYGVDILQEDFDLEKWRQLRGEYFTQLLKELSDVIHSKGKQFALWTGQGDYIGYPLGNMKLEWRKWLTEKTVDVFGLEEYGWAWGTQGYGYVTDVTSRRGLKPLDVAIREDYSPAAKQGGVKLVFLCRKNIAKPLSDVCCSSRANPLAVPQPPDYCQTMEAMPEFDGVRH
jgi:hypothetical protein